MSSIVQNDTSPIKFFMTLASDTSGRTPAPDLSPLPVFKIDKGAGMVTGGGVVTQASTKGGWYYYTPVAADVNTLGDLGMEASAATADTWRDLRRVVQAGAAASDWTSARAAKVDTIDTNATAIKAKTDNLPPDPADESLIIAATDAINTAVGNVPANVRTNLTVELGRIDASVSSRASAQTLANGVTLTAGERTATAGAILATVVEANGGRQLSVKQILQLIAAFVMGKISGITAGTGTQTTILRSATDLQTILTYTDDELGNRTNVVETIP